jgi:hypothetical protein
MRNRSNRQFYDETAALERHVPSIIPTIGMILLVVDIAVVIVSLIMME